ncbi:hypothetical protein Tco_0332657 [Tanacetum coccineum]
MRIELITTSYCQGCSWMDNYKGYIYCLGILGGDTYKGTYSPGVLGGTPIRGKLLLGVLEVDTYKGTLLPGILEDTCNGSTYSFHKCWVFLEGTPAIETHHSSVYHGIMYEI